MDIKTRIKQYLEYKGISDYRFERDLSLSKGYFNKAKNPTSDILMKMCGIYTDISPEWLLTGEGSMLKIPSTASNQTISGNVLGNGSNVISGSNLTNVGNNRYYEVPKSGFLKIIHPDGREETISGDSNIIECIQKSESLKVEIAHLKDSIVMKDDLIASLKETIELLRHRQ